MWESKFHIHTKQQAKLYLCISQSLHFWMANWMTKDSAANNSKHSQTSVCSQFLYEYSFDWLQNLDYCLDNWGSISHRAKSGSVARINCCEMGKGVLWKGQSDYTTSLSLTSNWCTVRNAWNLTSLTELQRCLFKLAQCVFTFHSINYKFQALYISKTCVM